MNQTYPMNDEMERTEVWVLPAWASDVIMETLAMDSDSSMIETELRTEIRKAMNHVHMNHVPIKTRPEWVEQHVRHFLSLYEDYHESQDSSD
jgi:hypothetical protein